MSKYIEFGGYKYLVSYPRKKIDGSWNCLAFRVKKNKRGLEILANKEVRDPVILHELGKRLVQLKGEMV